MLLVQFITDYVESILEVILIFDANESVVKGKLSHQLQKLALAEAYSDKFKTTGPAS